MVTAPRSWLHGLFDCGKDCSTCKYECDGSLQALTLFLTTGSCVLYCLFRCVLVIPVCLAVWIPCAFIGPGASDTIRFGVAGCCDKAAARGKMRTAYNIRGNECSDFCSHCLCSPCALTQETLQLRTQRTMHVLVPATFPPIMVMN